MTDEEKAEDYAIKDTELYRTLDDYSYGVLKLKITEGYLAGLEEGRKLGKEDQWKATEKAQKKTSAKIRDLEKENEELKEKLKGFESGDVAWQGDMDATIKQNLELKNEIDELKALHESDKKATALLMQKWEAERNELKTHCKAVDDVNEKMKCCQNCNHNGKPEDFEHCRNCDRPCASPNDEIIKDEWELEG